jgi:hypothetical protein
MLLYGLWVAGGIKTVVLTSEAAALTAWGFTIKAAGRRGPPSPAAVTVLVLAGILSAPWALQARPQVLALPLFAAVLWLLLTDPELTRRRTLAVLPLLVLWANVHGSVVLGVGVVGVYALAAARTPPRPRLWPYLATPLTLFASPYAGHLAGYYRLMLFDNPFREYVPEWKPSTPAGITAVFYVLVAVTVVVVARRRRSYHLGELAILALTCAAAALAIRNIVWFALAAAAILPVRTQGQTYRTAAAGAVAIAAACVIPITAAIAVAKPASYWQGEVSARASQAVGPLLPARGAVLGDDRHADWLLWTFPRLRGRLVYDDRFELLKGPQLRTIVEVLAGGHGTLGACTVVVDPDRTTHLPGRILWQDSTTAVLRETSTHCRDR